ncbi:hypothetical protein BKA66DRAFT_80135 [Pyrenochaeta sp. MPI-SDFR-AT-0127]|nr:hypothetical protein BKA66DRAFT_80135 [Pyrenochaeta sp. MPI-SDFR-AT-0127]
MEEVTPEQFANFNKGILIGLYAWTTSNTLVRISTILLYLRIFPIRTFSIFCWVFLALNVAYALATFVVALLICRPIDYTWDPTIPGGYCGSREQLYMWHGTQNLLHDIILVAMPMPLLWKLHLPIGKKVSLIVIFAMGLSICVLTLARTIEVSNGSVARITQDYVSVALLTMLEPLLGVINCSLPVLRPVGQKLFAKFGKVDVFKSEKGREGSSYIQSIGAKRRLPKPADPYRLDTGTFQTLRNDPDIDLHSLSDINSAEITSSSDTRNHTAC